MSFGVDATSFFISPCDYSQSEEGENILCLSQKTSYFCSEWGKKGISLSNISVGVLILGEAAYELFLHMRF